MAVVMEPRRVVERSIRNSSELLKLGGRAASGGRSYANPGRSTLASVFPPGLSWSPRPLRGAARRTASATDALAHNPPLIRLIAATTPGSVKGNASYSFSGSPSLPPLHHHLFFSLPLLAGSGSGPRLFLPPAFFEMALPPVGALASKIVRVEASYYTGSHYILFHSPILLSLARGRGVTAVERSADTPMVVFKLGARLKGSSRGFFTNKVSAPGMEVPCFSSFRRWRYYYGGSMPRVWIRLLIVRQSSNVNVRAFMRVDLRAPAP